MEDRDKGANVLGKVEIPTDQKTFKIGEVARLLDLEPYVLRYWETEFEELQPEKTRSGQRVYRREDIELLSTIQDLLHVEQYTIVGARRQLEMMASGEVSVESAASAQEVQALQEKLVTQANLFQSRIDLLEGQIEDEKQLALQAVQDADAQEQKLTLRIEELLERLDQTQGVLDEQHMQVKELELQVASANRVDEQWSSMNEQLGEDMERLEQELVTVRQEHSTVQESYQQLVKRHDELTVQRDQLQIHCTELMTQRTQLESHCDELSARLRAQRQGKQRALDVLRQELVELHHFAKSN